MTREEAERVQDEVLRLDPSFTAEAGEWGGHYHVWVHGQGLGMTVLPSREIVPGGQFGTRASHSEFKGPFKGRGWQEKTAKEAVDWIKAFINKNNARRQQEN